MAETHLRVPDALAEAARQKAGLPRWAGTAALARYALARLAGWNREAALSVARVAADIAEESR
jgi:hypothetical protein